jgi:hypothetical protein
LKIQQEFAAAEAEAKVYECEETNSQDLGLPRIQTNEIINNFIETSVHEGQTSVNNLSETNRPDIYTTLTQVQDHGMKQTTPAVMIPRLTELISTRPPQMTPPPTATPQQHKLHQPYEDF